MQAAIVKVGNANMAEAIAEGMVKAENKALKETVSMLVAENEQLRSKLGLYEWERSEKHKEQLRLNEERSRRAADAPWYLRFILGMAAFARELC